MPDKKRKNIGIRWMRFWMLLAGTLLWALLNNQARAANKNHSNQRIHLADIELADIESTKNNLAKTNSTEANSTESDLEDSQQLYTTNDASSKYTIANSSATEFYGTLNSFAENSVYFLMTDRFVNGDKSNDYPEQGGDYPSYRGELADSQGNKAWVGYLGGDFKGIIDNADYIKNMGFGAIWLTPIVDQPDAAFPGGEPITYGGAFKDGGKSGYHGYWGSNFFKEDEHLVSPNLNFKELSKQLNQKGLKTVLDIVLNHGSPAFTMPKQEDKFGKVYDQNGRLVADQQNLSPKLLSDQNPLHQMISHQPDIMQLLDFNPKSPKVLDYFCRAYNYWITQGADAFRIDTIKHMPHSFWRQFSDCIRSKHADFFMFAESYSFDPKFIAQHTWPKNGAIDVLDFPGRAAMKKVFEDPKGDYSALNEYLYLEHSPYRNSCELMTFYDNHDMSRLNTSDNGFIDANNWLFTARGIPVLYYGSEMGFMRGKSEHQGNRNYFGEQNIQKAKQSPIYQSLKKIANARASLPALQKGIQVNLLMKGNKAAFLRIFQHQGVNQTALVLLNKGDRVARFAIDLYLSGGQWRSYFDGQLQRLPNDNASLETKVDAHSVQIWLFDETLTNPSLNKLLNARMRDMKQRS